MTQPRSLQAARGDARRLHVLPARTGGGVANASLDGGSLRVFNREPRLF